MSPMPPKRRRTKGSGSVFIRGAVYWIQYRLNGRRLCESANTSDKATAENLLRQKIGQIAAAGEIVSSKATISDLCQLVVGDYEMRSLRDLPRVKMRIRAHIGRLFGKIAAVRLGTHQVRVYVKTRQDEGAGNATINRELAILRRGFALAAREDPPLIRKPPYIPTLEESEPREGFIEQAQYELLLAHLPTRFKALFVLGYHFGCRLGELRKLKWSQVDFDAGTVRLTSRQTKAKEARALPFYGDVREWLERQREYCHGDRVFCYRKCESERTTRGTAPVEHPFGPHMDGWREACEAVGFPGLLFHDLRRSAVRNMVRAGIPESVARQISGHKTASVFQRYNIIASNDLAEAAKRMDEFTTQQKAKATQLQVVKGGRKPQA